MAYIKIEIDGKKIIAEQNKTIYEIAKENGIDIPVLCHDEQLEPFASCFVCVVKVQGYRTLVPSCSTKVVEGMVIDTNSEEVRSARKACLELLLSNHYADCIGPCQIECPASIDIQGYLSLAANGKYSEALKLIKEKNPLPAVCGRVCTRPCEVKGCRRNILDETVGIDYVKRYVADQDLFSNKPFSPEVLSSTGKKIAVIGAGPAGLSASYYLAKSGHKVIIFEAMPEPGGMLRYGIPEYRLPKDVLDKEISTILDLGVELKTYSILGEDFTIVDLQNDGYDAIFLGLGAWDSTKMRVEGEEAENVFSGIKFLEKVGLKENISLNGKVVVVGGGNTAIDCARTSLRSGAKDVVLMYRRTEKEMPANEMEIHEAKKEGIKMEFLTAPIKVNVENGKVKGLKCIKMELGKPDASGRRSPVPISGSEFDINCDYVFGAIGQSIELSFMQAKNKSNNFPEGEKLNLTRWNTVNVNQFTFETSVSGVFSGGDVVTGAATAIEAIAAGRKAAYSINTYLSEGFAKPEPKEFISKKDFYNKVTLEDLRFNEKLEKQRMPELEVSDRITNFKEVELGFSEDQTKKETIRCLECGCSEFFECELKRLATEYNINVEHFKGDGKKYSIDKTHPFIELDPNKCILCGRCVRTCNEIIGVSAYGFINRGFDAIVKPTFGQSLLDTDCISCGMCIETCPTGAITSKSFFNKPGPWKVERTKTICNFCGVGCQIDLCANSNTVVSVKRVEGNTLTNGNMCIKGKFGFNVINREDRAINPLIRNKDELQKAEWNSVLEKTGDVLKELSEKYNPEEIAVFVSPYLTNEELYLIQKFARLGLKTNNIASFSQLINYEYNNPTVISTATYNDVKNADLLFIINSKLDDEYLVADLLVKKALMKNTDIIYIYSEENNLSKYTTQFIKCNKGTEAIVVTALNKIYIEKYGTSNISEINNSIDYINYLKKMSIDELSRNSGVTIELLNSAVDLLFSSKKKVTIFNRHYKGSRLKNDNHIFNNLSIITDSKQLVFAEQPNYQGMNDMGVTCDYYSGFLSFTDENRLYLQKKWHSTLNNNINSANHLLKMLSEKKIKLMLLFGEDPYAIENLPIEIKNGLEKVEYLIVSDIFLTESAKKANIFLPMSTFAETSGTYTNSERRMQKVRHAIKSPFGWSNWNIIVQVAINMGLKFRIGHSSVEEITEEIKNVIKLYNEISIDSAKESGLWSLNEYPVNNKTFYMDEQLFKQQPESMIKTNLLYSTETLFERWKNELFDKAGKDYKNLK